jgi:hypothetical protein
MRGAGVDLGLGGRIVRDGGVPLSRRGETGGLGR